MLNWLLALIPLRQVHYCREDGVEAEIRLVRGRVNRVLITVARPGSLMREESEWGWMELKLRLKTGWSPVPMPASQLERWMWRAEDAQRDRLVGLASVAGGVVLAAVWLWWPGPGRRGLSRATSILMALASLYGYRFLRRTLAGNPWGPFIAAASVPAIVDGVFSKFGDMEPISWWVFALWAVPMIPVRTPWDGDWDPRSATQALPKWRQYIIPVAMILFVFYLLSAW